MFKVTGWVGNEDHARIIRTEVRETAFATANYWLTALHAVGVTISEES